jgi:uncharacterized damage-inducible protein DinB
MFRRIADFEKYWASESDATLKILRTLTDASLVQPQAVDPEGRTLGRLAWHVTGTIPEMMGRTGLTITGPEHDSDSPASSSAIAAAYEAASRSLLEQIGKSWTDATLDVEDEMYGERWPRAYTLQALVVHQAHHRGQMTVLMRQAGLTVPGIVGPAREEWAAIGMAPPKV